MSLSETNTVTVEGADLGRYLFYDPVLSSDSSLSCSGCHKQSFAFSDSTRFSTGKDRALMKRNTMPLFNLAWYPSFFWDGRAHSIENQISHPLNARDEMKVNWEIVIDRLNKNKTYKNKFYVAFGNEAIDSTKIIKALGQFLRTLISHSSKYDKVTVGQEIFSKAEYNGFVLINDQTKGDCLHCHTTDADALGTTLKFSNNGLDSVSDPGKFSDKGLGDVTGMISDNGKFKIPSLRNVALTAPYMHDGRFKTLEEVLEFYSTGVKQNPTIDSKMEFAHRGGAQLSAVEKQNIIAFLKTMTDSVFITDPEFSNPFIK